MLILLLRVILLTAWCVFIMDLDLFANILGQITVSCSNTACWYPIKKWNMKLINKESHKLLEMAILVVASPKTPILIKYFP